MSRPEMKVIYRKIKELVPWENNPKMHDIEAIEKSVDRFGPRWPIIVQKKTNKIIAGHGRAEVYAKKGFTEVPTLEWECSDEEAEAFLIADNNLTTLGGWDDQKLLDMISEVQENGLLETTGFTDKDIDDLIKALEPDDPPVEDLPPGDPPKQPISKRGEIYALGPHRLMCGDALSGGDVDLLMDGKTATIAFTSPPYNTGCLDQPGKKTTKKKYNDDRDELDEDEYYEFLANALSNIMNFSEEVLINIGLVEGNKRSIIKLLNLNILKFKDIIYWKKDTVAPHIQKGVVNNLVEFILCFGNGKRKFLNAQFDQGTYWNVIEGENARSNEYSEIHKATFPIYLPENIIKNFTKRKSIVLDPFIGTGTTLMAAEQLGRVCYAMDIDPVYIDVTIDRWEKHTGLKAEKISTPTKSAVGSKE